MVLNSGATARVQRTLTLFRHYCPWLDEYREIIHPRFLKDGRPLVPFSSEHLYVLACHQDHPPLILLPVLLCLDCLRASFSSNSPAAAPGWAVSGGRWHVRHQRQREKASRTERSRHRGGEPTTTTRTSATLNEPGTPHSMHFSFQFQ